MLKFRLWLAIGMLAGTVLVAGCGARNDPPTTVPADVPETSVPEETVPEEADPAESGTVQPNAEATDAGETEASVPAEASAPVWLADAETYQDEWVGFALDYPAGWSILDVSEEIRQNSTNYAVTLTSWEPADGGSGGIPEGGTKIDVVVYISDARTLEETVDERLAQWADQPPTVLSEERWSLDSGLEAMRWHLETMMGESAEMVTHINGFTVLVAGLGDLDLFNEIARTLRPLE